MRERFVLVERSGSVIRDCAVRGASPEGSYPRSPIPSYHLGAQGAHDHPFVSALLEEIHKNKLTANVFSIVKPFFGDAGLDYGHIAEHLHIHRSNFKRQEFVLAGFKIA